MLSSEGIFFQDVIREFLDKVGFDNVPRWGDNRETFELGGQEIDAFARLDDLYVVVDAKTASSLRSRGRRIQSQLNVISGYKDQVIRDIRARYESLYGYRDCLFIFWTKGKKVLERHRVLARQRGIALRDSFDLRYYLEALRILENKEIVRNSFLKDISLQLGRNVFREGAGIDVEALRTRIGNKKFYTFLIQARHLLRFAYVFRVEMNNILASYQRLLNKGKIRKIRQYLRQRGFFANNILVATDVDLQLEDEDDSRVVMRGTLRLPDKPCYLEIIDGQHRLLAYSNLPDLMNHCLCVTAISGLNEIERAKLFVVVNREQTKVPAYLLWDLYTLIEPRSLRGKISKFVQRLNENGPLKDLIRLPRIRSPSAYLSFTNLCSALFKRTNLYRRYGERASFFNVVKGFLEVIKNDDGVLGEDWARSVRNRGRKGFVCTNNALSIHMYLLSMILRQREENGLDFPANVEIEVWKRFLRERMVAPLRNYLENNRDREAPEDPYGALRRQTTNEGARREAANMIFAEVEV